jgi:hypothetical protein
MTTNCFQVSGTGLLLLLAVAGEFPFQNGMQLLRAPSMN